MNNKYACGAAAILLAFMIAIVIVNSAYVRNTADHIISSVESLPENIDDAPSLINEIAEYWNERRKILNIALSEPELELISSLFDELIICAEESNEEEYKKTMARLLRAIEDIKKLEEISLENLF